MRIYRARRRIDHGQADGTVAKYAPGDQVPGALAKALPELVEAIDIPDPIVDPQHSAAPPKRQSPRRQNGAIDAKLAEAKGIRLQE